jgi:hypothetical protein
MTILNVTVHNAYIFYSTQTKSSSNLQNWSGKSHQHLQTTSTTISIIWKIFTQSSTQMPLQKTFPQKNLTYWWQGKAPRKKSPVCTKSGVWREIVYCVLVVRYNCMLIPVSDIPHQAGFLRWWVESKVI